MPRFILGKLYVGFVVGNYGKEVAFFIKCYIYDLPIYSSTSGPHLFITCTKVSIKVQLPLLTYLLTYSIEQSPS